MKFRRSSRRQQWSSVVALSVSLVALSGLVIFDPEEDTSDAQPLAEVVRPTSCPELLGSYFMKSPGGVSVVELLPNGEYRLTRGTLAGAEERKSETGIYAANTDSVTLLERAGNLELGLLDEKQEALVRVRWGCCQLLVPPDAMTELCQAANAGSASPALASLKAKMYRSTGCVGEHLAGTPTVPAKWKEQLLAQPILTQIDWTTWANVARVNGGTLLGIRPGLLLYSKLPGGSVLTYRVLNAYGASSDVVELGTEPGWTRQRHGALLSTRYPADAKS